MGMESMEIDHLNETNGSEPSIKDNGLHFKPVPPEATGVGLPYAPENFPNPGDNWTWRVGRRVAITGHYVDRYLYLPKRLCNLESATRRKHGFASKLSTERYVRSAFPEADIRAFFDSFSWKIPAKQRFFTNGKMDWHIVAPEFLLEHSASNPESDGVSCKAGNQTCCSLEHGESQASPSIPCDICCAEPRFCRECCCILCSKTVNLAHGGYSYIKCEAVVQESYTCGHIAHIDCALRSYMAGTVGGCIGLDAEYYCRRCDARTDLVPHVARLFQTCESIDSREDIEKILNVGVCILRDSQKENAKELLHVIESSISKLQSGSNLEDIWKAEGNISAALTDDSRGNVVPETTSNQEPLPLDIKTSSLKIVSVSSADLHIKKMKLDEDINQVLQALRNSQEAEYKLVEERLEAQKKYLNCLYEELEKERSDLATRSSSANPDPLLNAVLSRVKQIKREVRRFNKMAEVSKGFGRTSKAILKELYGVETKD